MKITALVAPFQADAKFPTAIGPRKFDAVDEFAAALSHAAGVSVPVIEGSWRDAPDEGYLILFEESAIPETFAIASRVILINVDRSTIRSRLERDRLAGAVEKHRYFLWRTNRSQDTGRGLFGRKEVAARMGATLASGPPPTDHYGLLISHLYTDLPSLIASYLTTYDTLRHNDDLGDAGRVPHQDGVGEQR